MCSAAILSPICAANGFCAEYKFILMGKSEPACLNSQRGMGRDGNYNHSQMLYVFVHNLSLVID